MAASLLSIPIMLLLSVLQSVAFSRINLMGGSSDIILLAIVSLAVVEEENTVFIWALIGGFFISILSAMSVPAVIISYLLIALLSFMIHRYLWQSPILAILLSTALGTIVKYIVDIISLQFTGIQIPITTSVGNILLPNLILNLFFIFPTYIVFSDLVRWVLPKDDLDA